MVDHTAISDSNTSENSEPQQPTNPPYRTFPRQPWLAMMLEPRITLRAILASENPRRGFWLLLSLIAISSIIGNAANGDMAGLSGPELFGAMFGVLLIPLLYVLMYLSAWVLRLVGRWLGGDGELTNIVTGMVWSQVPTVFTLLLSFGLFALFGMELLHNPDAITEAGMMKGIAVVGIGLMQMMFACWGLVLGVASTAVTLNISPARSLATQLIAFLLILIPFIIIALAAGQW